MADVTTPTDSPTGWVAEHTRRYLGSGGEDGHLWHGWDGTRAVGVPTLLLTTRGRTTGIPRRTPLIYSRHGDGYVVVASKGGAPDHPQWYRNLLADPQVDVQVGAEEFTARARTADADEKAELWPGMTAVWPDYDLYQARTSRDIPVVILDPV
jgi:deazaflavin-dependent oxidoreductase (nitroreductase family)